ncbi:hypothetical protein ACERIT_03980 [Halopenitus sp. H-Gu1]|uniref:hypothetical protein n=1 Tax=Halopenitus sp. H-Gu1 TaxID=3242697 RepID=UPI00359E2ED6
MPRNGDSDAAAENDGGESGTGYRRLEGELNTVRSEFETLVTETEGEREEDGWIQRGREMLDKADEALEGGKIEQGWSYLHAAKRLSIYGLEAAGGKETLRGEARVLLVEAANAPLSWRSEAVTERLANADGTLREDLTANDLYAAQELLHEGYENVHRKRQHFQSQFHHLQIGAIVTVVAFLVVAIGGTATELLPSPFLEFPTDGSSESTSGSSADFVGFLVYVVLAGMLGATLFGLRSLRRQPGSTSTPQYLTGFQATLARIAVGAGSALAVFFFVRSELFLIGSGSNTAQGPFLIAVAFAAGYSQRLVHSTVESLAGMAESESSESEGSA